MADVLGLGFKGGVLGFATEDNYGEAKTRTKFIEINTDGVTVEEEHLESGAIPGIYCDDDEVKQSLVTVSGDFEHEMRYEGSEVLLYHAMGSVSTVEVSTFTVDATNNKFNFNIGGDELTATVASASYPAGLTQATAGSLCKAIYDAIVAAEAVGTYTVAFNTTTLKFTITRSAGTFSILWKTGTNGSDGTDTHIGTLVGYSDAADDTGALTYTSDSAVVAMWTHTFSLTDALPKGISLEFDEDTTAKLVEGGKIDSVTLSSEVGGFLMCSMGILGEDITTGNVTGATLPTASLVTFAHGAITYGTSPGASTNVKSFELTLANNLKDDRRFIGSRLISEPQRSAKIEVTGANVIEFLNNTEYDAFRAMTTRILTIVFTNPTATKTGHYQTITITIPILKLTGGVPQITDEGPIELELPFKAYATDSTTREFTIAIKNTVVSVS